MTRDEWVTIATTDGDMRAYVVMPQGEGRLPALIVVQEAFGVNAHIQDVCRRFADQGYVAIAPEIFHREEPGVEVPYSDVPAAMGHLAMLTNDGILRDLEATLAYARTRADVEPLRVGLVGFCVGGFVAFLGACHIDVAATVSFYGGGIVRERPNMKLRPALPEAEGIRAPILCIFGGEDKGIPPEDVDAIRKALDALTVPHDVIVYPGAPHAFFCDQRQAYHPEAARKAWTKTIEWLEKYVKPAAVRS